MKINLSVKDAQITKHFNIIKDRLYCRCGCGSMPLHADAIDHYNRLEELRVYMALSFVPISGHRCKKHNASPKIRGSKNSRHVYGNATDIQWRYGKALAHKAIKKWIELCERDGLKAYGVRYYAHMNFIHFDSQPVAFSGRTRPWVKWV